MLGTLDTVDEDDLACVSNILVDVERVGELLRTVLLAFLQILEVDEVERSMSDQRLQSLLLYALPHSQAQRPAGPCRRPFC